jgi:general secretion pathway protein C
MRLRFSGIDRARHAEAALLCCALLAALALWLLVRLVWTLLPRGDAAFDTPLHVAGNAAGAVPAQSIAKWHLFGSTPLRPGAGPGAPATTLSLILRGTVADRDPRAGIAVISDPDNGERALRVGEEVAPGARLAGVYADHVVLEHEGSEETLKLPRDRNLAPADVLRPTPVTVTGHDAPAGAMRAGTPAVRAVASAVAVPGDGQPTIADLRSHPEELMRRVQVVPVLDGGKLAGVRLSAGADAALIGRIGLRPGDVITAVNGLPIDSFARGQQILSSLGNAGSARVTVLRDGKSADITVGLQ